MKNIFNFFRKNNISEPPWDYDFLVNLPESEYPKYLAKIFNYRTGEKLPLRFDFKQQAWVIAKKRCKTFNQKLQWIKLYGVTDLMRMCTDKVAVRDYVAEKIGSEYLKPVLQIIPAPSFEQSAPLEGEVSEGQRGVNKFIEANEEEQKTKIINKELNENEEINKYTPLRLYRATSPSGGADNYQDYRNDVSTYFDQIQWDKLPNAFVIKCNHGCKWQYIIKDKEQFLNTPKLVEIVKRQMTGWLEQEYFPWNGFEMQYKGIKPQIIIEPLMREKINKDSEEIQVYSFNGIPKILIKIHNENQITILDEKFTFIQDIFGFKENKIEIKIDKNVKQSIDLSKQLSNIFCFVRVDWLIFQNKLYFEELTYTPYSGFFYFKNKINNLKLGNLFNMER